MTALDPEIEAVLRYFEAAGDAPPEQVPVDLVRAGHALETRELCGPGEPVAEVCDIEIAGPGGAIPVRVYRPAGAGPGWVVYLHGGGWVVGSVDSVDAVCRALANRAGQTVAGVGYRLAPEHPFPAGLDDALGAVRWAVEQAGDAARVAVAGDSAGANLATVAARRLRDEGVRLAFQALVYPSATRPARRPPTASSTTATASAAR